ncbi:MAG TPA: dienelactone hydrolase family protein [Candidatus Saccharimonadales bacterium]|nr:dienelactone hydrolase family protein [Candidatus Saccharimonadales bacterium]
MGKMIELTSEGGPLEAYLAEPAGEVKGAIIVIHEIWALNDHTKSIADRLAAEGYVALAPNLLAETNIAAHAKTLALDLFNPEKRNEAQPKLRALMTPMQEPGFGERTLARVQACFNTLFAREDAAEHVAITGFCFGGSYSFNLAIHEPRLKIALPFYGHAPEDVDELRKIKCPVRAFYGANDEGLMTNLPILKELMKEAKVDFEATVYPGCGHAFFNDTNPFAYNQVAATDAWQKVLAELAATL